MENKVKLEILSKSANEAFARIAVAAFASQIDPTIEELADIKTAVSEAVTNCIVHGYKQGLGVVYISVKIFENGHVIMYADKITDSMRLALDETARRRKIQMEYNKENNITPKTIKKSVQNNLLSLVQSYRSVEDIVSEQLVELNIKPKDLPKLIDKMEKDMAKAAKLLDFERAIQLRDEIKKLKSILEN